jgi:uncharacterized membrane protein YkoI
MQNRMTQRMAVFVLAAGLSVVAGVNAADNKHEGKQEQEPQKLTLAEVPAAVRATIDKELPGAKIEGIEKEQQDGKVVYDVEAEMNGKNVEMDIASDGSILSREDQVPFASLPASVKSAAEKYFGSPADLDASREVAGSKTSYEVEGVKAGQKVTLKLDDTGKILEEEKQHEEHHEDKD